MAFRYELEPGRIKKSRYNTAEIEPLISIITPYYNAGKYFEQTFNSVMNQTFPWYEWIVVDDGSADGSSVELLEELARQDSRMRVLHQENGGAVGARKHGIRESKTDVIILLDADDLIEPTYVEYMYWALKRNPGATWSYSDSVGFDRQEYEWKREFSSERMRKENILSYIGAIRKEVYDDPDIYDDATKNLWEDYQFWLKMLAKGFRPARVELELFWYRRLDSGELSKINRDPVLKKQLQERIKSLAKEVPNGIRAITFNGKREKEFEKLKKWVWESRLPFAEEKTRILMLIPHMECGGADKFNLDVLKNIDKSKYEIGVITTNAAGNEWRQRFYEYADDVFEMPAFLDMNDWAAFVHYYIYTRDVKLVWNISSYYGYYLLPWLRMEFPETAVIDCVHAEGKYWRNGGYPRVSAAMDDVLEKTFVTNAYTRDIMVERYGKKKENMQVIYTGIDENEFDPQHVDCSGLKAKLGIREDRQTVLYLCRIAAEKRPFLMLEIARKVRERIPGICFLCVGEGPQLEELKSQVHKQGLTDTVLILGGQADVKPYYKLSDLLLLCSLKEGLSITTMEAMAMETPVVSADVGSQYELVTPETGRLVKCRQDEAKDFDSRDFSQQEVEEYAQAICELLGEQADLKKMSKKCREKLLDGFTLSCLMEELDKVFANLTSDEEKRRSRARDAEALSGCGTIFEELLATYIEYENVQIASRGATAFLQHVKDVVLFKRSIFSVLREVYMRRGNLLVKAQIARLFRQ